VAVALVTGICHRLQADLAIASVAFLLVVLVQSFSGDFLASVLVSIEAVAVLDYFFVAPLYSFGVLHGAAVVFLSSFLITALIVTKLVSRVRAETESARLQRERFAGLYRLAQQLLAMDPQMALGAKFLEPFRGVFGITAVCIFDAETAETHVVGGNGTRLEERTRQAYVAGRDSDRSESGMAILRLQVVGRTTAYIGFEGLEDPELTAGPLSALAATLLERTRALRHASDAAAAAQAEVYRSAILDALAHEFKTPLATILAAAGGLREAGPLGPEQLEMTETVESEAARLGNLASRLLRMARVDREEVKPRMELIELNLFLAGLMDQYVRRSPDRRISLRKQFDSLTVEADPELLRLAVSQLLENACKYSLPGSTVSLETQEQDGVVQIRVRNSGSSIPASERHRIFDRFYRGSDARDRTPGSGLGLYVARKIALAHGGGLELESQSAMEGEVSFRLTIPGLKSEADRVVRAS
jgi:two-component system, OmpR family, sensor histidine kinase KdpD